MILSDLEINRALDLSDVCVSIVEKAGRANALRAPRARERGQSSLSPPSGLRPLSQERGK